MSDMPTTVESGPGGLRRSMIAGMQLALMGALSLLLITSISPVAAIKGDFLTKLLFIGRFVALVAAATLLLKLSGRRWADAGLRKVKPSRFFLAIPLGIAAAFAISFVGEVAVAKLDIHQMAAGDWFLTIRGNLGLYLFFLIWTPCSACSAPAAQSERPSPSSPRRSSSAYSTSTKGRRGPRPPPRSAWRSASSGGSRAATFGRASCSTGSSTRSR
jgi:hypothetical protein